MRRALQRLRKIQLSWQKIALGWGIILVLLGFLFLWQMFFRAHSQWIPAPGGIYTESTAELPSYQLYFKELNMINARAAKREDYPESIDLVQRGVVQIEPMVSHVLPLGDLEKAITMLAESDDQRMKVILEHV